MRTRIDREFNEAPLAFLSRCGGYYKRPPGGPLVGYKDRDEHGRQYVGFEYVDFSVAETNMSLMQHVAYSLIGANEGLGYPDTGFCGVPTGGVALAIALAFATRKWCIYPDKEVVELKTKSSREISFMIWGRHNPEKGDKLWVVEDVCNQFSSADEVIQLIERQSASVAGIVCFLNRSMTVRSEFISKQNGKTYPVIAHVTHGIQQFSQDDPKVSVDVRAGNVIWKPRHERARLAPFMKSPTDA